MTIYNIIDDYIASQPNPDEADREVATIVAIADDIAATVKRIGELHAKLEHAVGTPFCAWSTASMFIDAVDLSPDAARVLLAAVERHIPAPHRMAA
jgi:hypothetical protein